MRRGNKQTISTDESNATSRRRVLRTLGAGATVSALGMSALTGTAAAHNLTVKFRGCQEVLIAVNDPSEFGVLKETIHVFDAETGKVKRVGVELTRDNTGRLPKVFGDKPVFWGSVSGDDHIVAVETGDGRMFENPNDCSGAQQQQTQQQQTQKQQTQQQQGLTKEAVVSSPGPQGFQEYTFEVTGEVENLEPDEDGPPAVDEITEADGRFRVEGAVSTGDDRFAFSGELIEIDVPPEVTLEIRER